MMIAICRRNLKIYYSNRSTIFFSLLGSLIVFGLYMIFLRKNMLEQFKNFSDAPMIVDLWVLGGLLTTTSLTTSFTALGQLIKDKSENKLIDFITTGQKAFYLTSGYFLSACLIAFTMQLAVLIFCLSSFYFQENIKLTLLILVKLLAMILLNAVNTTAIHLLICLFIKSESTLRTISSMLGALAGFISTAYLPIGAFSGFALVFIKILPTSYASSSFRRILISPLLHTLPDSELLTIKEHLGVGYSWNGHLTTAPIDLSVLIISTISCFILLGLFSKKINRINYA